MAKFILSAHELFLLCALRKTTVQATNLMPHTWTIGHDSEFSEWLLEARHQGQVDEIIIQNKQVELKIADPGPQTELRTFGLKENDFGFALVDVTADMTWYQPETRSHFHAWDYRHKFELEGEITEKEAFILKHFG